MIIVENPFGRDLADFNEENSADRIGRRIRKIRETQRVKLSELAKCVGISADMLQKYENGQRKPKLSRLKKIASALGVATLALTDPALTTYDGTMYALFEMEERHGLSLVKIDGKVYMMFPERPSPELKYYVNKWYEKQESVRTRMENASEKEKARLKQEYYNWEWTFPDALVWRPSLDDKQREKEALEKRLKELNEELKKENGKDATRSGV